ncbi:MAG: sugar phosphate isomerase/epimerase [Ruminococcaceae bacterium]|nr:sugar phosphate isomerase/epimerase [Oscillospiraceae bacterium]
MDKKISTTTGRLQIKYGDLRAVEIAAEAGYDGIDFNVEHYAFLKGEDNILELPEKQFEDYFTAIRKKADECGIKIVQTHNLCGKLYNGNDEHDEKVLHWAERGLKANEIMGCEYTVIHPISTMDWGQNASYEVMHEYNQKMFGDIIPFAEKYGIIIAPESFGVGAHKMGEQFPDMFADHEKMRREYDDMQTKNKAFCLDTGHTHCATQFGFLSVPEFIRYFGNRIKLLHIHDNDGIYDMHLIPRKGGGNRIKWPEVFDALDEIGYDGYYNFEVSVCFGDLMAEGHKFLAKYYREFIKQRGNI